MMNKYIIFSIVAIFFSCSSDVVENDKNKIVNKLENIDVKVDEIPRTSVTSLNAQVLILNEENDIYVNVSTVEPENTKLIMDGNIVEGKKGLFKITPKELGRLTLDVQVEIDGIEMNYGRTIFYVVSPETTIAEIFKMNKE